MRGSGNRRSVRRLIAAVLVVCLAGVFVPIVSVPAAQAAEGFPGTDPDCEIDGGAIEAELIVAGLLAGGPIGAAIGALAGLVAGYFLSELGWTWVDPANPMQT